MYKMKAYTDDPMELQKLAHKIVNWYSHYEGRYGGSLTI